MASLDFPEVFVGDNIILEKVEQSHAEDLYRAIEESREHIAKWLSWLTPDYGLKDMQEFIEMKEESFLEKTHFSYVIIDKKTEMVLGSIELFARSNGSAEYGYYLVEKAVGKGAMSEALNLIEEYAFNNTPIIRLGLFTLPGNKKSMMVAKRNGYAFEGIKYHREIDLDGKIIDGIRFVKVKDESVMQKIRKIEPELIKVYDVKCLMDK